MSQQKTPLAVVLKALRRLPMSAIAVPMVILGVLPWALITIGSHTSPAKSPVKSPEQSLQPARVWVHHMPQLPEFNMQGEANAQPPYGALYPLELRSSQSAPQFAINPIQRMQAAGINGVQLLTIGHEDPTGFLKTWLSDADRYPGFVVAPCLLVKTEAEAVNVVKIYTTIAATHPSAAKQGHQWVISTYGARYGKSPDFWRRVRQQLARLGIEVFLINDAGADLAVNGGLKPELLSPYFPVFDASYLFDDSVLNYWSSLFALFKQYRQPLAGGIMPGYNRETPRGGYNDAKATEYYRRNWEIGLAAGLSWQTLITWNDIVEHTAIRPSSDWNWTRADISAFYAAKLRRVPGAIQQPQLYITTAQQISLGQVPRAEGLILNPSAQPLTVKLQLVEGNGQPYGQVLSAQVPAYEAGAVTIPDNWRMEQLPSRRFLRAKAEMYDATGRRLQQVTSAPILIQQHLQHPLFAKQLAKQLGKQRTLYYSIPAAKALPGTVQLQLTRTNTSMPNFAEIGKADRQATVIPPASTQVRFAEVLQNTRLVKNLFNQSPLTTAIPLMNGQEIIGHEKVSTSSTGFYVARVIDQQERVGYSDPIYLDSELEP